MLLLTRTLTYLLDASLEEEGAFLRFEGRGLLGSSFNFINFGSRLSKNRDSNLPSIFPSENVSNAGRNTVPMWYNPVESSRICTRMSAISIKMVCMVYGGRDGFGLAVLKRLSFSTRSLRTCKIVSNSDLFSLADIATLLKEAAPSAERAAGLPVRGDGAGEFALDEAGDADGVRSLGRISVTTATHL